MFRVSNLRVSTLAVGSAILALALVGAPAAQAAIPVSYATATAAGSEASMDWSGWDVTGGSYNSVAAAWTVPAVTCAAGETSYSADWVGLDGDGSDAVEQVGTSSDCDAGTAAYSAWYEFYPSVSMSLANRVHAGDKITASVAAVPNSENFTVKLTDVTAKWTVSKTESSPEGSGASAEIIAEAPSGSGQSSSVLPLADFKKVTFTGVTVDGSGLGSVADARSIAMVDSAGNAMATVSALGTAGAFDVTWVSSGADTAESTAGRGGYTTGGASGTGGWGYPGTTGDGSTGDAQGGYGDGSTGDAQGGYGYGDGSTGDGYGYGYGSTGDGYGYGYGSWGDAGGWGGYWQS